MTRRAGSMPARAALGRQAEASRRTLCRPDRAKNGAMLKPASRRPPLALQGAMLAGRSQGLRTVRFIRQLNGPRAPPRRTSRITMRRAFRESTTSRWKASGMVKTVRWYSAEDTKVCQFCARIEAREPIPWIRTSRRRRQGVRAGKAAYDSRITVTSEAPPMHPLCRC